jgi:hypothetical protein
MPAAGNHENELGNGPIGHGAYQTYFTVPDNGAEELQRGLWYAFTAAAVRIISLNNDGDRSLRGPHPSRPFHPHPPPRWPLSWCDRPTTRSSYASRGRTTAFRRATSGTGASG